MNCSQNPARLAPEAAGPGPTRRPPLVSRLLPGASRGQESSPVRSPLGQKGTLSVAGLVCMSWSWGSCCLYFE